MVTRRDCPTPHGAAVDAFGKGIELAFVNTSSDGQQEEEVVNLDPTYLLQGVGG
jgi:hypothetical protein